MQVFLNKFSSLHWCFIDWIVNYVQCLYTVLQKGKQVFWTVEQCSVLIKFHKSACKWLLRFIVVTDTPTTKLLGIADIFISCCCAGYNITSNNPTENSFLVNYSVLLRTKSFAKERFRSVIRELLLTACRWLIFFIKGSCQVILIHSWHSRYLLG